MTNFLCIGFPTPSHKKRVVFFLVADLVVIISSLYISFLLRFDFHIAEKYLFLISEALPIFILVKLSVFALFKLYGITWRYVDLHDMVKISKAVAVAQAILVLIIMAFFDLLPFSNFYIVSLAGFPRSIFIIDGLVSFLMIAALRVVKRVYLEIANRRGCTRGLNTVIIGAGNIGETVVRDLIRQKFENYYPVAILDDDEDKKGSLIHGVKIIGGIDLLIETVRKLNAEAVIIAIPSLNYNKLRKIYNLVIQSKVKTVKIVPNMYMQQSPGINTKHLEDIRIEDLIGRQNVTTDFDEIKGLIRDKVVLVTGAGGSIGSEIVMQVSFFAPGKVILLDADETELHHMELKIKKNCSLLFPCTCIEESAAGGGCCSDKVQFIVADIRDRERIDNIFKKFKPQIIFHSAAYKHVPMMECNPEEAVAVNIIGTYNLAISAKAHGVEKFIMISTDKAVYPTSIMGATKRVAESVCRALNADGNSEGISFISVRFGNVLGSRGSILPLFMEQLKEGGPLTVTHKDMKRYFMTIPEAVALVLQASAIGKGGDIMVLDMGEPVKITTLAEKLIRLHGLEPYRDIQITFTGIRPGENLSESLLTDNEVATRHEKIFVAKNRCLYSVDEMEKMIDEFRAALSKNNINDLSMKPLLEKHIGALNKNGY
jgi:FlaA1/EpsC-like NDP-sugar epimerase